MRPVWTRSGNRRGFGAAVAGKNDSRTIATLVPHGRAIAQRINGVRFIVVDELALDQ